MGSKQDLLNEQMAREAQYEKDLLVGAFQATQKYLQNEDFLAIMKQIFEITGYDIDTMGHGYDPTQQAMHAAKRDVWIKIRSMLVGTNFEALSKIELHKDINRRKG